MQALRTVQSYNLQARVVAIYNRLLAKPNQRSLYNAISSGAALGFGQGIMFWVYAFAFWYGGRLVDRGEMNLESTMKVFFSILLATMGISQAQIAFPDVSKGSKAVARVFRGALLITTAVDRFMFSFAPSQSTSGAPSSCGRCCLVMPPDDALCMQLSTASH